jgi:adenine-specific DNA-methyltransferase
LTLRKIPQAVLRKCEWGKDDYSLKIANLPEASTDEPDALAPAPRSDRKRPDDSVAIGDLFGGKAGE